MRAFWEDELGISAAELFEEDRVGRDPVTEHAEAWAVLDRVIAGRAGAPGSRERLASCVGDRTGSVSEAVDCLLAGREPTTRTNAPSPMARRRGRDEDRRRRHPGAALREVLGEQGAEMLAGELSEEPPDLSPPASGWRGF